MVEKFGRDMYDSKYSQKETPRPRSVVLRFVDNYLNNSRKCLDLGCGAGRHSGYVASRGINVTGIDLSEEGVRKTSEVLENFPGSQAVVGDIHQLPFEDESFDSLICNRVLDYNDDKGLEIALSEIERVMKNNSIMFITVRSISQFPKEEEEFVVKNEDGGMTFRVTEGGEKGAVQHYFTQDEIKNLMERHNFEIIEMIEDQGINKENKFKAEWEVIIKKKEKA